MDIATIREKCEEIEELESEIRALLQELEENQVAMRQLEEALALSTTERDRVTEELKTILEPRNDKVTDVAAI